MTDINTFKIYYEYICRKVLAGGTMPEINFDTNCDMAQMQKYAIDYETFAQTGVVTNFLQTFLVNNYVQSITPTSPIAPYPPDFQYLSSAGTYYNQTQIDATLTDNVKWREMLRPNSLNYPTKRYPKYQQIGSGIMFAPNDVGIVYFDYFKTPITPHWGSTEENNEEVYNPVTSINFEWDKFAINEIMGIFLQIAGISIKDNDISAFATAFTKETNLPV